MRCEICGGPSRFDFAKQFDFLGLTKVEYWRCRDCGFVLSRTHAELPRHEWERLNALCHALYQGQDINLLDPKWKSRLAAQAKAISELAQGGLLDPQSRWLDFGCGDGALPDLLETRFGLTLAKYDQYMASDATYLSDEALRPGSFDFVITTSVFEHLTRREQFDRIESLVSPAGAFGLHTLVAERVPSDPEWFYLEPPHCAFFSNAAMDRLFRDWGYRSSLYIVDASLWVWFREEPGATAAKVERLNAGGAAPFLFAEGFFDYWKVDPRRRP
jgi:hypothetical protein